jgi:hypothetical protein
MVQTPRFAGVMVAPDTAHTDAVVEAKLTGSPEEAVALAANGGFPKAWFGSVPKEMVWLA